MALAMLEVDTKLMGGVDAIEERLAAGAPAKEGLTVD